VPARTALVCLHAFQPNASTIKRIDNVCQGLSFGGIIKVSEYFRIMPSVKGKTPGGRPAEVRFAGAEIESVALLAGRATRRKSPETCVFLAPGFIDIQVNGFAGLDFNRGDFRAHELISACRAILRTGVTRFCPTLISAPMDQLCGAVREIRHACEKDDLVREMVLGIHLEGPYISSEDGPRGAHPRSHVSKPNWEEFERLLQLSNGGIRLVTVAPELPGALEFIRKASRMRLVIGLGHCSPEPEIIDAAVEAGAKLSTHLGNGAHHMLARHANYIQKQMAHDGLMASIICDGHHLPDYFVKNLVRAKGRSKVILITDAAAATLAPSGRYSLGEVTVEAGQDGILRLAGTPYLAGSTLTMDQAIGNCTRFAGIALTSAVNMATVNPARLVGGLSGRLEKGQRADVVVFRFARHRMHIEHVYLAGRLVYSA
jgi:N-acetylglucosamine-6-phosphate deacetylase